MDISNIASALALQTLQAGQQTALLAIKNSAAQEQMILQALTSGSPTLSAPPAGNGQSLDIQV